MNPGRELDTLVASEVMGWKRLSLRYLVWEVGDTLVTWEDSSFGDGFKPSTDIASAWQVIEYCCTRLENVRMVTIHNAPSWYCKFHDEHGEIVARSGFCDTAPHAICLAALEAKA